MCIKKIKYSYYSTTVELDKIRSKYRILSLKCFFYLYICSIDNVVLFLSVL